MGCVEQQGTAVVLAAMARQAQRQAVVAGQALAQGGIEHCAVLAFHVQQPVVAIEVQRHQHPVRQQRLQRPLGPQEKLPRIVHWHRCLHCVQQVFLLALAEDDHRRRRRRCYR